MTSRAAFLLYASNDRVKMSCSEAPSANSFLVDSLISGRSEGNAHYYYSGGTYLPSSSDYSYGLSNCGYFPGLKRPENHSMAPIPGPYMQGMESWLETSKSCRVEQLSSSMDSRSFSPSIKEESSYCFYESGKCPKSALAADASYTRVSSSACSTGNHGNLHAPGYSRLSQTCSSSKSYYPNEPSGGVDFARFDGSNLTLPAVPDRTESEEPAGLTDEESKKSPSGPVSSPIQPESEAESPGKPNKGWFGPKFESPGAIMSNNIT